METNKFEFTLEDRISAKEELANSGFKEYVCPGHEAEDSEFIRFNEDGSVEIVMFTPSYLSYRHYLGVENETQSIEYVEGASAAEFVSSLKDIEFD